MIVLVNPISDPTTAVVLGADVGGTSTRVAVADLAGTVLAVTTGPAGNPAGVGRAASVERIHGAAAAALHRAEQRRGALTVVGAVLGLAGVTTLVREGAAEFTGAVLPGVPVRLVSDFAVAFSSATASSHGIVTIAGTGSGAVEVRDGAELARRDGWGWLLGDEGSGQWLGREAVRETLRRLEAGMPPGPLGRAVLAEFAATTGPTLVAACYRGEPRRLSELARLVGRHAADDTGADRILARGAQFVAGRVLDLVGDHTDLPVVLAGSLVTGSGPLAGPVHGHLEAAGVTRVHEAGDGLGGALWLALQHRGEDTAGPAVRWSELLGSLDVCRSGSSVPSES